MRRRGWCESLRYEAESDRSSVCRGLGRNRRAYRMPDGPATVGVILAGGFRYIMGFRFIMASGRRRRAVSGVEGNGCTRDDA